MRIHFGILALLRPPGDSLELLESSPFPEGQGQGYTPCLWIISTRISITMMVPVRPIPTLGREKGKITAERNIPRVSSAPKLLQVPGFGMDGGRSRAKDPGHYSLKFRIHFLLSFPRKILRKSEFVRLRENDQLQTRGCSSLEKGCDFPDVFLSPKFGWNTEKEG